MGDYPGSGYTMSSYGLKLYNPQETVGQWTQCCKVQHTCVRKQTAMCYFVVGCGLGEEAKLFHFLLILARRCDQEEPCCHYRRRRCNRLVESRETKIFRSCTRYQLFPCQDSGMFDVTFASPVPPFLKIRAYEVWNVLLLSSCYWQK